MYVFISFEETRRSEMFGPASLQECRTWLKLKKINPCEVRVDCNRLLSGHEDTSWFPEKYSLGSRFK